MNALLTVLILWVPLAAPAGRPASDKTPVVQAQAHFRRAVVLYEEGYLEGALVELRRAALLAPSFRLHRNIAQVCAELRDWPCAVESQARFLSEGRGRLTRAEARAAAEELARLELRVGYVRIVSPVDGLEVFIDGTPVGVTPLSSAVTVGIGRRRLSAVGPGRGEVVKVVDVAGRDELDVVLAPARPAAPLDGPDRPSVPRARAPDLSPAPPETVVATEPALVSPTGILTPTTGWLVTGGLAVAASFTGVLAMNAATELSDRRRAPGATTQDLAALDARASGLSLATNLLAVGAALTGAVSTYLSLSSNGAGQPTSIQALPGSVSVSF